MPHLTANEQDLISSLGRGRDGVDGPTACEAVNKLGRKKNIEEFSVSAVHRYLRGQTHKRVAPESERGGRRTPTLCPHPLPSLPFTPLPRPLPPEPFILVVIVSPPFPALSSELYIPLCETLGATPSIGAWARGPGPGPGPGAWATDCSGSTRFSSTQPNISRTPLCSARGPGPRP